ncbi:hypothetical protein JW935_22000 [candidate division KSB1 bacterium]|nr:hypothetical protein [candidate division KSB1 bacterium]
MIKTVQAKLNSDFKKQYTRPAIIHSTSIETVAGRCAQSIGCTPSQVGHSEPGD